MSRPQFPTTNWDLVQQATTASGAFERLLAQYLPAMRWHLERSRGLSAADADDVLQEFVVVKLIEAKLFATAQPDRGRFRSFLLTTLNRFTVDWYRQRKRQMTLELRESIAMQGEQLLAFEAAWARSIISQAIDLAAEELSSSGREAYWRLFDLRVVQPALTGAAVPSYAELSHIEFPNVRDASNALVTAKRCFHRHLLQLADVDPKASRDVGEILLKTLAAAGARSTPART